MTDFTTGNDFFLVRWTLSKAEHHTHLDGSKGEFLRLKVPVTIASLVSHLVAAQGVTEYVH